MALFIISGPSGAGKGTVVQGVMARRPDMKLAVSCTTRPARPMEREGVNYYFISHRDFAALRDQGGFLEFAEVHGNWYGTPRREVEDWLALGHDVILEIDVQGAAQVKTKIPDVILIFIEPPSMAELEKRLRGRSTESDDAMDRRLADAYDELRKKHAFDAVIVNEDLNRATEDVLARMEKR